MTINRLQTTLFLTAVVAVLAAGTPTPALAQTASDSGIISETTQKLKERIGRIVEEKRDQIQGAIDEIAVKKRGFIGEVTRVSAESITVKNTKGTQIVPLEGVRVLLRDNKSAEIDDIVVGDWAIVMGLIEDDAFVAKRISVSSKSLRPRNHFVELGSVEDIDRSTLTLLSRRGDEVVLDLTTNTEYQDRQGDEIERIDITTDMQVLVIGYQEDDDKTVTVVRALVNLDV